MIYLSKGDDQPRFSAILKTIATHEFLYFFRYFYRAYSPTWSASTQIHGNKRNVLHMESPTPTGLSWYTNMAAVTSCEYALQGLHKGSEKRRCCSRLVFSLHMSIGKTEGVYLQEAVCIESWTGMLHSSSPLVFPTNSKIETLFYSPFHITTF